MVSKALSVLGLSFCEVICEQSYSGELIRHNQTHKKLMSKQKSQHMNVQKATWAGWPVWVVDIGLFLLVDKSIPETIYRYEQRVVYSEALFYQAKLNCPFNLEIFVLVIFPYHKLVHFSIITASIPALIILRNLLNQYILTSCFLTWYFLKSSPQIFYPFVLIVTVFTGGKGMDHIVQCSQIVELCFIWVL